MGDPVQQKFKLLAREFIGEETIDPCEPCDAKACIHVDHYATEYRLAAMLEHVAVEGALSVYDEWYDASSSGHLWRPRIPRQWLGKRGLTRIQAEAAFRDWLRGLVGK